MNVSFLTVTSKGGKSNFLPRIALSAAWLLEMGFVKDALVQAVPEPDGMRFTLCESAERYSDLLQSTYEQDGKLIRVAYAQRDNTSAINTTGRYILSSGLSVGDPLIVLYSYGFIRLRKMNGVVGAVGKYHDKRRAGMIIPKIRLFGDWLKEAGFVPDALATAGAEPGCITLTLHDQDIEQYSTLVKYARENKLRLFQLAPYYKNENLAYVAFEGPILEKAGFVDGNLFNVFCEYGLVKLQKIDLTELGFTL